MDVLFDDFVCRFLFLKLPVHRTDFGLPFVAEVTGNSYQWPLHGFQALLLWGKGCLPLSLFPTHQPLSKVFVQSAGSD
jgi:hypothetical protein